MALSFHATAAPPLFGSLPAPDLSFLQDVHPEVTDALLGFVYDPLDYEANAAIDDLLNLPPGDDHDEQHCATNKKRRACDDDDAWYGVATVDGDPGLQCNGGGSQQVPPALPELPTEFVLPLPAPALSELPTEFVLPPPPPPPALPELPTEFVLPLPLPLPPPPPPLPGPLAFARGADANKAGGNACQSVQSAAAKQRRRRISEKTAELSRLIPGGHKLNTAEMLQAAGRHVKLLQAQVGMLALMHAVGSTEGEKTPSAAQEQMHALLVCGGVQERLAAEGKCLVPRKLVGALARDAAVRSNPVVNRDLGRFVASLPRQ